MPSCAASGFSAAAAWRTTPSRSDAPFRLHMLVHLDAAQRQKIVDQPAHAGGFHAHDVQELFARQGVVLGMDRAGSR